jgi:predicted transcriptional regulator of viral defense system
MRHSSQLVSVIQVAERTALPARLWRLPTKVVRTRDLKSIYARPDVEVARLAEHGILRHVAHGYWAIPPIEHVGDAGWRPEIEALALALAVADYGVDATALMGLSAARYHGAVPRALAVGVIAVPRQRPALATLFGSIVFVTRTVGRLQLTRARTPMATGYVTDIEQTMLDIAQRPTLGGVAVDQSAEAVRALALRADWSTAWRLAAEQRMPSAYVRARWAADPVVPGDTPILLPRKPVPGRGMRPIDDDAPRFGIAVEGED